MPNIDTKESSKMSVEKLQKGFSTSSFDCGRTSLNDWLVKYSWESQASDSATTYVVRQGNDIIAFYSLTSYSISTQDVIVRISQRQPKNRPISAIKIARLAVDKHQQKSGIGKALLKDALLRCINSARHIAARAVIVDALDEDIISFYKKFGFESGPNNQNTMMLLMKDLRKAYDES